VLKESVVLDLSTIPVAKYAAWRVWLQRVDGLLHRMVRLVPAGTQEKVTVTGAGAAGGTRGPARAP
jgi:hypothetical protein